MDVEGMFKGAEMLTRPAEEYVNDESVETLWVMKACQHADVYYNLISSVNPMLLKLTKYDDLIEQSFRKYFPNMQVEVVTESDLKSEENKPTWRAFCDEMKEIEEYSFGTLLRLDSRSDFTETNTILVSRVQFLAIEISRNRAGLNNYMWELRSGVKTEDEPKPKE